MEFATQVPLVVKAGAAVDAVPLPKMENGDWLSNAGRNVPLVVTGDPETVELNKVPSPVYPTLVTVPLPLLTTCNLPDTKERVVSYCRPIVCPEPLPLGANGNVNELNVGFAPKPEAQSKHVKNVRIVFIINSKIELPRPRQTTGQPRLDRKPRLVGWLLWD